MQRGEEDFVVGGFKGLGGDGGEEEEEVEEMEEVEETVGRRVGICHGGRRRWCVCVLGAFPFLADVVML